MSDSLGRAGFAVLVRCSNSIGRQLRGAVFYLHRFGDDGLDKPDMQDVHVMWRNYRGRPLHCGQC